MVRLLSYPPSSCQAYHVPGQIPGPTIEGDWGDEFVIHFTNNLSPETHNGTSLHFHGVQQLNTNSNDGANSITQCPIAPGDTYTYRWRATAYGSSWYHSHFGFQAWNGAAGAIVVHGPASANYDVDIGPVLMTDWNHWTSDMLYPLVGTVGVFDELTGLINGKNTWNTSISSDPTSPAVPVVPAVPASNSSSTTGSIIGEYYSIKFEAGLSYRLRLVNTAIESGFR
jgi:FtsP/CotA-like multicopper oxidase with cupredoxin domain